MLQHLPEFPAALETPRVMPASHAGRMHLSTACRKQRWYRLSQPGYCKAKIIPPFETRTQRVRYERYVINTVFPLAKKKKKSKPQHQNRQQMQNFPI